MNGSSTCTMPICTPVILNSSFTGWLVSPSAISARLTNPCVPRITIQAKVRTRMLVQNGIRMRIISTRRARADVVAMR